MKKVFVIAEAGVNHNGDFTLAKELKDMVKSIRLVEQSMGDGK